MSATRNTIRSVLAFTVLATCAIVVVFGVAIEIPNRPATAAMSLANEDRPVDRSPVIDKFFAETWSQEKIPPARRADELLVLRRASLALHGTIPSLETIREFEADSDPERLKQAVDELLTSPRFGDYFAERLARAWVGTSIDPFLIYRRGRFTDWLARQLHENRAYDEIVRDILATDGLWTSEPAANFVTAAINDGELDENELAARTVRGFLGQRIDCAQCHDHPFADWQQTQFQGLAAFFGQSALSFQGIVDQPRLFENELEFRIDDPSGESSRVIPPSVPFAPECLPESGQRRDRLAAWVTHPENERFTRATVNRVWGLLFGRPYYEPVDDLPDPGAASTILLDRLGNAFRDSGYDLRWLIQQIILSRPFQTASRLPSATPEEYDRAQNHWAVFPVTRLRPEQVIGAMIPAGRLQTIDHNSNLFARTIRFFREQDFVREYGDPGETELAPQSGTVPQALLRMNGKLTQELFATNPFNSTGRLAALAPDDERLLELCFFVTLTREPTTVERESFEKLLSNETDDDRRRAVEDLLWALVNTTEFSWNH